MPSSIPSVSSFKSPDMMVGYDPDSNPGKAAVFWLRRDIARGLFLPGERLAVDHLKTVYGLGATPIREAIFILSTTGLIEHEHQKGFRVASVSMSDYNDSADLYMRLHRMALHMSLERGKDEWEERVVLQTHRFSKVEKVMPDGDPEGRERWQRAYWEFHFALLGGCGSDQLIAIYKNLAFRLERYVTLFADMTSDRKRDHLSEHRLLVDAVFSQQRAKVDAALDAYFASHEPVRQSIREALARLGSTGTQHMPTAGPMIAHRPRPRRAKAKAKQ